MRCLIIDNYDSFTWNLAHYVALVFGCEPIVVRNDQYSWEAIKEQFEFDCVLVSPGPGNPMVEGDFHASYGALKQDIIPVLGICLGFQGLAYVYGGDVVHAPTPYHGRTSAIQHDGDDLFADIPSRLDVVRYHSLVVPPKDLSAELVVTAKTDDGLVMAIRHKVLPKWGVQFHPESIQTEYGLQLIHNFYNLTRKHHNLPLADSGFELPLKSASEDRASNVIKEALPSSKRRIFSRKIHEKIDAESVFLTLFSEKAHSFWLDSQNSGEAQARYSFMGCSTDDKALVYSLSEDNTYFDKGHNFLASLNTEIESFRVEGGEQLPFEFKGGMVGFFSYEMRVLFAEDGFLETSFPDAIWMKVDSFIAYDHVDGCAWVVYVGKEEDKTKIDEAIDRVILNVMSCVESPLPETGRTTETLKIRVAHSEKDYKAAIRQCRQAIVEGESYELCLTNKFSFETDIDPFELYRYMRKDNAAPFGAYIKSDDYFVLSTSPERFLRVDESGVVQTKPIKGTISRSSDAVQDVSNAERLKTSEKDRAENLMIVDLMRNDLSRVSIPGTVNVPKLMDVESYKTVHQLVSTVESTLKPDCTLIDLLTSTFPGGSISGAPKIRTMKILNELEGFSRGVYCGSIGYLGYNRLADINIAIRTISCHDHRVEFGAGGAITYLSDEGDEYAEMILKAEAVLKPIWRALTGSSSSFNYRISGDVVLFESEVSLSE